MVESLYYINTGQHQYLNNDVLAGSDCS
uniref:Uncharacterized protein n=1 Tax=Anguilla anguilla TaxID=7936 RepID=A0A0E9T124_ANGAN